MTNKYIEALHRAKEEVEKHGHTVIYIAIYWSQNYGLETEFSDIDYKAITLPSLDDLVQNSTPLSIVIEFEWGQIDIKDIRAYANSAVKVNINFIEILNTEYFLWDESLRKYFFPLLQEMGSLYLKGCYGMMMEKFSALRHPYPWTIAKIEKFGYDPKQIHHIFRLHSLMKRHVEWNVGKFMHEWEEKNTLIKIKLWSIPNENVDKFATELIQSAKRMKDEYLIEPRFETKYKMLDETKRIIKQQIIRHESFTRSKQYILWNTL